MAVEITVHPGLRRGVALVVFGVVFAGLLAVLAVVLRRKPAEVPEEAPAPVSLLAASSDTDVLLPVVDVCVREGAVEAVWIEAVAAKLKGQPEAPVAGGRMDVRTDHFAIEIDFLDKWHEGVGQSLHYASESGLRPALGLVLRGDDRRSNPQARQKLREADKIAAQQGIRVFILESSCPGV